MKVSKIPAWLICAAALALASWQVAAQSKKAPPAKPAAAQPFDISATRLPPKFAGADCVALAAALKGRIKPKTEFETQAQYETRIATADIDTPVLGQLRLNDPVAIVLDTLLLQMRYDAEHQEASFSAHDMFALLEPSGVHVMSGGDGTLLQSTVIGVKRKQLKSREYVGVNAFGARVRASETKYAVCGAVVVDPESPRLRFSFNADVPMEPGKAQALKPNLGVLVVGRLAPPYTAQLFGAKEATISSPDGYSMDGEGFVIALQDVWYFDRSTGEVITRVVADQKARDAIKFKDQQPSSVPGWPAPPAALSPNQ